MGIIKIIKRKSIMEIDEGHLKDELYSQKVKKIIVFLRNLDIVFRVSLDKNQKGSWSIC